jgi:mxaJ protein
MYSLCRNFSHALVLFLAGALLAGSLAAQSEPVRQLRVCADPNNLPFSNIREEGFENRIAEILARELKATLHYTWWAQRRGFIRNTLKAGSCDLVVAVPAGFEMVDTTDPYYRSTYVFVYRKESPYRVRSFDDPILRSAKVGVHLMGDDYANTPPAHALSRRGIIDNVVGFPIYGDYSQPNPPARILDALAAGRIDVAIVWGPLAGFFTRKESVPLVMVPVSPVLDQDFLPMEYDIAMGVRHGEKAFKGEIEAALKRRRDDIRKILRTYGIPQVAAGDRQRAER